MGLRPRLDLGFAVVALRKDVDQPDGGQPAIAQPLVQTMPSQALVQQDRQVQAAH